MGANMVNKLPKSALTFFQQGAKPTPPFVLFRRRWLLTGYWAVSC
ncbi:hypothetical protein HMPREF1548_05165 [Clostridium sp. KLE 1755]|nr:hypothetical protein HMPREF1548_05165 [Clostridium sp. KLE 1755]